MADPRSTAAIDGIELHSPTAAEHDSRRSASRTSHENHDSQTTPQPPSSPLQYPGGIKLCIIVIGLILSIFLAAIDSTIISTAIPSITDQFGSINHIAWYASAYGLANAGFKVVWGKAYKYFNMKRTFLLAVLIFEAGNVICALSPNSTTLIVGRVVTGMGAGGVMTGSFIMIAMISKPEHRAGYMGISGLTFGTASVVGPLLGGALTDGPGWRWCFWINLPIGFAAAATVFLSFKSPVAPKEAPLREKLVEMDLQGGVLVTGALSCYVLAMHWAAIYPWQSARVICTFVGGALLLVSFIANEKLMGSKAMVQPRLLKNKLVLANLIYIFFLAGAFFPLNYTLTIQFQSINAASASQSGIRLIPLVLGVSVSTLIASFAMVYWPHHKPFLLLGALLATAGNSNIYTLGTKTPVKQWIGFELITAIGVGLALQTPNISNQRLVPVDDIAAVISLTLFFENCGSALFIATCEAAFTQSLMASLAENLTTVDPHAVLNAGATQIRHLFMGGELDQVLLSYLEGCKTSHIITATCGATAALVSMTNAGPAAIKEIKMRMKKSHTG